MRSISRHFSRFAALFGHRFGLAHDRIVLCFRNASPLCPSWRFSARLGRIGRCTQRCQNGRHTSAHLPWSDHLLLAFPGSKARLSRRAHQNQLIHSCCYNQAPAFKLFRTANPRFRPEEILLEKAAGVLPLLAGAPGRNDLAGRQLLFGSWQVESMLIQMGPSCSATRAAVQTWLQRWFSILPSSSASEMPGHCRRKAGDNDSSGSDLALLSQVRASASSKSASLLRVTHCQI